MAKLFLKKPRPSESLGRRERPCRKPSVERLEERVLMAGDMVIEWNNVLLDALRVDRTAPPRASRAMAIVHTSIYDSVNSIDGTHVPYKVSLPALPGTSLDAAVAAAAHRALVALFPAQQAIFDAALASSLATIPDGPSEDQGVSLGETVTDQILALRSADGSADVVPYTPGSDPGDWQPTPPGFAPALLPNWPFVTPWAMTSGDQFRSDGIPALASPEYTEAFNEVKVVGAADAESSDRDGNGLPDRTPDQSAIARFWANGAGTSTPSGHLNVMAQQAAISEGNTLVENARLFALLNIAQADAAISCWDTKYATNFWRPVTGIRAADTDGNPDTIAEPTWSSFISTPPFPSYSSGHSSFSGAAAAVLAEFFGNDEISFTLKSEDPMAADRSFTSFSQAALESALSRLYGGIHWSFDNFDGFTAGQQLGEYVAQNFLRVKPLAPGATLVGSDLILTGSDGADRIEVKVKRGTLIVYVNWNRTVFDAKLVSAILVNVGDGNDFVSIDGRVRAHSEIDGGAGNDVLIGGGGNDLLIGGLGNDQLHGRGGHDTANGGQGDDLLFGGAGVDALIGGPGSDFLFAGDRPPRAVV